MQIEKTAKTVNIAIDEALKELNTTIDNIDYTVLQEPSKGFLGIFSKPAKVVIKLKEQQKEIENKKETIKVNTEEKNTEKKIPKMVLQDEFKRESKEKSNFEQQEQKEHKNINQNAPEIAKEFLKEVFEKMKIDININIKVENKNQLMINLEGKDIGVIIGKRGQTLDSLQYLVNLIVNKGEFAYMSVNIDTEDYRERRKQTLENLAVNLAKKVRKINRSVSLEPMNPYERRIIHSKLQNDKTVKTYSEGEEPFRYIVIAPK